MKFLGSIIDTYCGSKKNSTQKALVRMIFFPPAYNAFDLSIARVISENDEILQSCINHFLMFYININQLY